MDLPSNVGSETGTGGEMIIKGISIKKLRDKNKAKYYNYKIRRKAKSRSVSKQSLIHEYFVQTPRINRNVVGNEANENNARDGTVNKSASEAKN